MVKTIQTRADPADQGSGMGHEDAFPPTTLNNRSRLGKPTFAGTRGNEQDAPTVDIPEPLAAGLNKELGSG